MNITPLNAWHHSHHGRMVDFAGWEMPVQYTSIVEEHLAVRRSVGLFDISHMGRLEFRSDSAESFLNRLLTCDVARMKVGDVRYSLVCRPDGGILDDVLIGRMNDRWDLVVNASNREKILGWLPEVRGYDEVRMCDRTFSTAMIAVQGPDAVSLVSDTLRIDVGDMKYYSARDLSLSNCDAVVSRTGYTGEDGFELVVPTEKASEIWSVLMQGGRSGTPVAAGLGCRDTLRLEAAMPLYGHELNESTDPITAGLSFAVRLRKAEFIGLDALKEISERGSSLRRVGLILEGRRIARENSPVLHDGNEVGHVTSGSFSPTLDQVIAMAYVPSGLSEPGTALSVSIRGSIVGAKVVPLPFYRRAR